MTKVASEILYTTDGKGDIAKLRNKIKSVEASQWYDSKRLLGKKAGDQGGRWCEKCQSTTHDTDVCWGKRECKICGKVKVGQLAAVCWKKPANATGTGAVKSAQYTYQQPPPPSTQEEAKKAKQAEKKQDLVFSVKL